MICIYLPKNYGETDVKQQIQRSSFVELRKLWKCEDSYASANRHPEPFRAKDLITSHPLASGDQPSFDSCRLFKCQTCGKMEMSFNRDNHATTLPRLSAWMEDNLPDGFKVFDFPISRQKLIRTSNCLEKVNKEIRRRRGIFPNERSRQRLILALLFEISEEWEIGR